jgi:hypothetical protein
VEPLLTLGNSGNRTVCRKKSVVIVGVISIGTEIAPFRGRVLLKLHRLQETSVVMVGEFVDVKTKEQKSKVNGINYFW